jgi:hypothetical protein
VLFGALHEMPGGADVRRFCRRYRIVAAANKGLDIDRWGWWRGKRHGAMMIQGAQFALDGRPRQFVCLGFGYLNRLEPEEAVRRLAEARRDAELTAGRS